MRSTKTNVGHRALRIALGATLVAAAALAFSGEAEARGKYKHGNKHHRHHGQTLVVPRPVAPSMYLRPIVVPRRIVVRETRFYDPYRYGSVWYAPHRHAHVVYRFPVATRYGTIYEPHAYCDGLRFGVVSGPVVYDERPHGYVTFGDERVRFGIGF